MSVGFRKQLSICLVALCASVCAFALAADPAPAAFLFGSTGAEAGDINNTLGMAIDQEHGELYVGDDYNDRVDKFDQSGEFSLAWGWGVADGAEEFQTCTSICRQGIGGHEAGQWSDQSGPMGVAVDNEALSSSHGDVYVVDFGNFRVQKFDSSGKFLLMFGGDVNKKTGANVCVAGEECQKGTPSPADGAFEWVYARAYIAVGPGGAVYVGGKGRVQVFEPSGAWRQNISLTGLSSEGAVTALAVNIAGDVFVKDEGVPGVREFEPNGTEMPAKFDEGSESVEAIALDQSGNLLVADTAGGTHFLKFSPAGQEIASFGGGTLVTSTSSMAYDDAREELYVDGNDQFNHGEPQNQEYGHEGVWVFPVPAPGPVIESGGEKATPELRGAVTLEASIDPEGNETSYLFEYVDQANFNTSGYTDAMRTTAISIGSSFEDQPASAHLTGLLPGGRYHWRVLATDSQHHTVMGADESIELTPPALIEGPYATGVSASSVTFSAAINPLGADTTYRLEYGTSTSYGRAISGNAGEGTSFVTIGREVQGLEPGTTYHYRLVTSNEVGLVEGADHTVTTQLAGGTLTLPDGRAWELVSPPEKGGALIENIESAQAAADGSGIAYGASEPIGENVVGHLGDVGEPASAVTVVSERGAGGWSTRDISPQQALPPEGETGAEMFNVYQQYQLFSPDLSLAALQPDGAQAPLSSGVTERTLYLRNNRNETFTPLVSAANVPTGTKYGPKTNTNANMELVAATPDLGHVLFSTSVALTPEAVESGNGRNLYEWAGGQLELVNVFPEGATQPGQLRFGSAEATNGVGLSAHAISSDGRWVVFSDRGAGYYVRDMAAKRTFSFGGRHADWQTMSSDGSRVFFLESPGGAGKQEFSGESKEGELYVFDTATQVTRDLTADHLDGERSALVQDTLLGSSEDGSYVYFVAKGALAGGATSGEDNLYVLHEVGGTWTTTFIATLGSEDEADWYFNALTPNAPDLKPSSVSSRVSSNGRFVTFMSDRPLTGYDNRDAASGQPDEEVYLYDAATGRLACASCDPSGTRPVGVYQAGLEPGSRPLLLDSHGARLEGTWPAHWLAAVLPPAWHENTTGSGGFDTYQPRDLSNSGRLFFDSAAALVPQDTNGVADVYEYEPAGVGDCTEADAIFNERSGGCMGLISSGQSQSESTFFDASETGDDVFFITTSKLVSEDRDTAYDVYDAHVCSAAAPCQAAPVSPPACTSGDSCKAAPSPQPAIFGPPPSETFNGAGNVIPTSTASLKPKSSTGAEKLALALKACHKKTKRKRAVCERQARKRNRASKATKATRKGER